MGGRIQLAINVDDLTESIAFYGKLFGTQPSKVRPGYANFAIADPPLKLILLESLGHGGSLNHLGVEVADTSAVDAEQRRLAQAGLAFIDERDTTCCYALQNKFWVEGAPDGERWEIYTVLADSEACCGGERAALEASAEDAGPPVPASVQAAGCCVGQGGQSASSDACCA
jgi:catechol 2,3-dioxygenase-like lactoylglutathione lyase family enzyme